MARIPDNTQVLIKTATPHWANGEWGTIKGFDGEYYHVAIANGTEQLVFVRSELRVKKIKEDKMEHTPIPVVAARSRYKLSAYDDCGTMRILAVRKTDGATLTFAFAELGFTGKTLNRRMRIIAALAADNAPAYCW